jgi:hypothetical protein
MAAQEELVFSQREFAALKRDDQYKLLKELSTDSYDWARGMSKAKKADLQARYEEFLASREPEPESDAAEQMGDSPAMESSVSELDSTLRQLREQAKHGNRHDRRAAMSRLRRLGRRMRRARARA